MTRSGCRYRGSLSVPQRGRWFVYAELRDASRPEERPESWLLVRSGVGERRFAEARRSLYLPNRSPSTTAKSISTVAMYLIVAALVGGVVVLFRRQPPARLPAPAGGEGA